MIKKSFIASASGIKNIVFTTNKEDDNFKFIVGEKIINLRNILADFISPIVSHIHQSDPTIDFFCLNDLITKQKQKEISEMLTTELIENIQHISSGYSIDIDEGMCQKLRFFSILFGNKEIFSELNKLFPIKLENAQIDDLLRYIQYFNTQETAIMFFEDQQFFECISGQFHSIDKSKLLNLPKRILYSIICNEHLKVESEDSLFDFINKFFSEKEDDDQNLNIIVFYEQLNLLNLSQNKFEELIESLNPNDITGLLWKNLKNYFYHCIKKEEKQEKKEKKREIEINVPYDNNANNRFKGIITNLGNGNSKKVVENGIVEITSSAVSGSNYEPHLAIDFENKNYFHSGYSNKEGFYWLCYDFKEKKVKPSHYSVRSYADRSNSYNIANWNIEGSNDGETWKVLDSRQNERSLDGSDASNTFEIQNHLEENEFYRYLRIHKNGPNANGSNQLIVSSLEYFGIIKKEE